MKVALKIFSIRLWLFCKVSLLIAFGLGCFRAGFAAHDNDFTRPIFNLVFGVEDSTEATLFQLIFLGKGDGPKDNDKQSEK
jgi:hypothetical protein